MLGGDDDTDGIAGNIFSPGGEALEGDEVAGLDEGDEGALLVDTPEIDVAGTPITGPGPSDRFLIPTTRESQPPGWLSVVLMGHVFANWARTLFAIICQTYHWCQAPLIGNNRGRVGERTGKR